MENDEDNFEVNEMENEPKKKGSFFYGIYISFMTYLVLLLIPLTLNLFTQYIFGYILGRCILGMLIIGVITKIKKVKMPFVIIITIGLFVLSTFKFFLVAFSS